MRFTWTDNLAEVEREFRQAEQALSDAVREGVREAVEQGAAEARATHKYKDRTGALTASIKGRVLVSTPGAATGEIRASKQYASHVEGGTEPHIIRPKTLTTQKSGGRFGIAVLRFVIGGRVVYAREVHHPGSKPHPFMAQAHLKAERVLYKNVEIGVERAKKIIEG